MNIVKITGLCFILICSSAIGLIKADCLKKRSRWLKNICICFEKLYQMVCNSSKDAAELLFLSFGEKKTQQNEIYLKNGDKELLNRFLCEFGMGDRENECRNILLYKSLFEKQLSESEENVNKLYKLYYSLGFLVGLVICIFLV